MYSLFNFVVTLSLLSSSHGNTLPLPSLYSFGHDWLIAIAQDMVTPVDRRVLALRSEARDFVVNPLLASTTIHENESAFAASTDIAMSAAMANDAQETGPSITVLASPKPISKAVTVVHTSAPTVTVPVTRATIAPVVTSAPALPSTQTIASTGTQQTPYVPPVVAPPMTPTQSVVAAAPVPTPVPTRVQSNPAPIAQVAHTQVSGPTLVAVDSTNISNYYLTIPKLGITNAPIIPSDARTDAGIRYLQGVAQVLFPAGTAGHKTVIFGHSSNYSYVHSAYNEVFRYLNRLDPGDLVYIDINGQHLTYKVSREEIVGAETPSIVTDYGREELVLFTCWPYLSSRERYVTYLDRQF